MRILIEIRRIEVSFGIAGFLRLCTSPQQLSTVIHRSLHRFSTFPPGSEKKRAEPAFTSAEVRHASKSCSRGRFCAISYTLKEKASHQMGDSDCRQKGYFRIPKVPFYDNKQLFKQAKKPIPVLPCRQLF